MEESSRKKLLLNYGAREAEIFETIATDLKDKTNAPDNRTEIMRRGLHSFQYAIEVDDYLILKILSSNLKVLMRDFSKKRFEFAKALSLMCYSNMICKRGTSETELFESVILNLKEIDNYLKTQSELSGGYIRRMLDYITKSIDLIFLRDVNHMPSDFQLLHTFYSEKYDESLRIKNPYSPHTSTESIHVEPNLQFYLGNSYELIGPGEAAQKEFVTRPMTIRSKAR